MTICTRQSIALSAAAAALAEARGVKPVNPFDRSTQPDHHAQWVVSLERARVTMVEDAEVSA